MDIIVVGEDLVTREIIKKLLHDSGKSFNVIREDPIRGGEIKNKILGYNNLGVPVFTLTDLDCENCPIDLINDWFGKTPINESHLFRVANTEAECWLMADKPGFSDFLGIDPSLLPETHIVDFKNKDNIELKFPYKPSLYLMRELVPMSPKQEIVAQLSPKVGAKKGPQYNSALIPFIWNDWDIKRASDNSYSLRKAILRIDEFSKSIKSKR